MTNMLYKSRAYKSTLWGGVGKVSELLLYVDKTGKVQKIQTVTVQCTTVHSLTYMFFTLFALCIIIQYTGTVVYALYLHKKL